MNVTLLLCDSAQAVNGKLYILGGGWSIIGPTIGPTALALKISVPWNEANRKHNVSIKLLTADGRPFMVPGPVEKQEQEVRIDAEIEVGRPPGLVEGAPLDTVMAINIGPLPLPPGQRFEWVVEINKKTEDHWRAAFSTRTSVQAETS